MLNFIALDSSELLQYVSSSNNSNKFYYMDTGLMALLSSIGIVRIIITILILYIAVIVIMNTLKIKSPIKSHGVKSVINNVDKIRKRDRQIINTNRTIGRIKNVVEHSPFKLAKSSKDYWQYNLNRYGMMIPGGSRNMQAEEFHAILVLIQCICVIISLVLAPFIGIYSCVIIVIVAIVVLNIFPMTFIRKAVIRKNEEIEKEFPDFYMNIHHTLMASSNTALSTIIRSYDRTTDSDEMHRFVGVCLSKIDTYGDYKATDYITEEFKEIPKVAKLMRLIRQSYEGGEVKAELVGFRQELINERKRAVEKHGERLKHISEIVIGIVMLVLFQAILSAMSVYLSDITGSLGTF